MYLAFIENLFKQILYFIELTNEFGNGIQLHANNRQQIRKIQDS